MAPKKRYKPTYTVPSLVAQVAFRLTEPRRCFTVDELAAEFSLERRRVQRYLKGLRAGVFNGVFHPAVLRLEDREGRELPFDEDAPDRTPETRIHRASLAGPPPNPVEDLLPIYLAFAVLRALEGILPPQSLSRLWQDLGARLAPDESLALPGIERKFYAVPYAPKNYSGCAETLAVVVDALLRNERLRIDYYGLSGDGRTHCFDPYTLALHKGGLYLLGKSDRAPGITILSIERIDRAEKLRGEDGEPVRFRTPADFSPEKHFQGLFGIVEGEETEVELEIQTPQAAARLRERTIHPSQQFLAPLPGRQGKPRLRLRVRGTAELLWWILGQGPFVRVLRPPELAAEVKQRLEQAAALYQGLNAESRSPDP
jgi:predicted DNA-binding transcriptional regulator YafY